MNQTIKSLAEQSGISWDDRYHWFVSAASLEQFVDAVKQAIYDQVREELIEDELINIDPNPLSREYLKGCNGGTVDALCHIKNFGVNIDL